MLLHQVIHDEPPSPRQFNGTIPRDLETITLKCLAKDPQSRFATCQQLSEELQRWQRGEPILTRPVGKVQCAWRWCRRKPTVASLLTTAASLLIALLVVGTIGYLETSRALRLARERELRLHGAVDEFLIAVSESPELLKGTPGTQQLRKTLLALAGAYYEDFVNEHKEDETLRFELAGARLRLGRISSETGDSIKAIEEYERALVIAERLARENPAPSDHHDQLASILSDVASAYHAVGRAEDALASAQRALAIRTQLVKGNPNESEFQLRLAHTQNRFGGLHHDLSNSEQSLLAHQRAREIFAQLMALKDSNRNI